MLCFSALSCAFLLTGEQVGQVLEPQKCVRIMAVRSAYCVSGITGAAVSKLQRMKKHATVATSVRAIKVVKFLRKTSDGGRKVGFFEIGSICNTCRADDHCERMGEPYRSQEGRMTITATRDLLDMHECVLVDRGS